ncbi:50S ribosomal protein L11 methyltransferase [Selenomonas sp.]|uniref:50S ribosomal protein L11 methyltransferase n=1 Tax=Selenomonas sp. TaxID=2053611 RepID=UPI002A7649F2|nr:50S ribosomal protein L11 methyltransferase [Selenomonas sp.]MDY3298877.1 50S ribosomal protein L11 methyltransferase [Selenomonas sp.]
MKWSEVSIEAEARETDLVAACFYDVEATGVVIEDLPDGRVMVRAYLPVDDALDGRIEAFRAGIAALADADGFDAAACPITSRIVQDSDWENNWKAYFHTQRVGKHIVIQPSWEEYTPLAGDVVLRLDPESAFGTGTHPTTAMCLRALESLVRGGETVFDVGTGSGVLAIAAAKLGAGKVVAKDYARASAEVAAKNVAENGVQETIETGVSDLLATFDGQAELVVANIIADIIIRLFDELDAHLAPHGRLLASGIIDERVADVTEAAVAHGFVLEDMSTDAGWAAMVLKRAGE